jgi:tRNA(Ile)-lysidine synthase
MSPGKTHIADRLAREVERFVVSRGLISRGHRVLAAVSGGADSVALLGILHGLSSRIGFSLEVGHFDHGLRESARAELESVASLAASFDLPFHAGAGDVPAIVASTGDSVEEAARKARYGFLEQTADDIHADRIATGHTRTDQVETVLMRVLRGTGLRGLAGIPVRRGRIIRPILVLARSETVSYCDAHGLLYVQDASNEDPRFFRNRVRHELLPLLEARYDRRVQDNLERLADNVRSIIDVIRQRTEPIIENSLVETGPGRWRLETGPLADLDDAALVILLGDLFERFSCDMDFTRAHYGGLLRLVRSPRAMGKQISLPGFTVGREHGGLTFARRIDGTRAGGAGIEPTILELPGETVTAGWLVTTEILQGPAPLAPSLSAAAVAYLDMKNLAPPLVLRAPRRGDRMRPFGMKGTKKLSDIFIDKKIPLSARASTLVIADGHDILWLVGVATSETCRVHPATREILRIRVEKTERSTTFDGSREEPA